MNEYKLENEYISLKFLDYGAVITSLYFKNYEIETVLGYDCLKDYVDNDIQLGVSCVGPYAGRIENSEYTINNINISLDKNLKNHSIHGGFNSFTNQIFNVEINDNFAILSLKYNFLDIKVVFTLNKETLKQEIFATTSKATLFNPTNHTYFNLNSNNCLDYTVNLNSDYLYYLDNDSIPKDKIDINKTQFSILNGSGKIKDIYDDQFKITKFIDHPFHLNSNKIIVTNNENNIALNILTNQKYAVVYTGNYLSNCSKYINKKIPVDYMGICIETQNIPNGINMKNEESSILYPNQKYYYYNEYFLKTS